MLKKTLISIIVSFLFAVQTGEEKGLKIEFADSFLVGTAVNLNQVNGRESGADSFQLHYC